MIKRCAYIFPGVGELAFHICLECSLESALKHIIKQRQHEYHLKYHIGEERTSGCLSNPAACEPTLALSIFAVITSKRSNALSMPVAVKLSGSSGGALALGSVGPSSAATAARPPPAAIAPGPAGFGVGAAAFFLRSAGGLGFALFATSSSASRRAFSALRAKSALRFSSAASALDFPPLTSLSAHFSASLRSYGYEGRGSVSIMVDLNAGNTRSGAVRAPEGDR
jgi:hypothetical protein